MRSSTAEEKVRELSFKIAKFGKCSYVSMGEMTTGFLDAYLRKIGYYLKLPEMPYDVSGDEHLDPEDGQWHPIPDWYAGRDIEEVDFPVRRKLASFEAAEEDEHLRLCRFFFKGCKFEG